MCEAGAGSPSTNPLDNQTSGARARAGERVGEIAGAPEIEWRQSAAPHEPQWRSRRSAVQHRQTTPGRYRCCTGKRQSPSRLPRCAPTVTWTSSRGRDVKRAPFPTRPRPGPRPMSSLRPCADSSRPNTCVMRTNPVCPSRWRAPDPTGRGRGRGRGCRSQPGRAARVLLGAERERRVVVGIRPHLGQRNLNDQRALVDE